MLICRLLILSLLILCAFVFTWFAHRLATLGRIIESYLGTLQIRVLLFHLVSTFTVFMITVLFLF